ncbi:MAG: OB-fold domain-containing protein [Nitriliruptorales bacterium]|nr:OB-fold domain-containing protein [Nitriliruptorales bacterium]
MSDFDERTMRPRPVINPDNEYFWAGVDERRFLAKVCTNCDTICHPARPMCASCQSTDWTTRELSGRGTVYSYVVHRYPPLPGVEPGTIAALLELDEGIRFVSNLVNIEPEAVEIGMPVELTWVELDPTLTIPAFRPVAA